MYTLPTLPYGYDALVPVIDEATMKLHHTKHHQTYIDKLNAGLEKYPEWQVVPLPNLMMRLQELPEDLKKVVQNHGGGHLNHSLFWQIMKPVTSDLNEPVGDLASAINQTFGNFSDFKKQFSESALALFGSGWVWLVVKSDGVLAITTTSNQNSPLIDNGKPILGLDVWEHAYYLNYQNRRAEYVENFFSVINWEQVEKLRNA